MMTDTTTPTEPPTEDTSTDRSDRRKRWLLYGGIGLVAVLAIAAFGVWYFLIRDDSPPSVLSAEQEAARDEALAEATDPPAADEPVADAAGEVGLDGTFTVDTSIGDFADFSSTFVGFRIDEELASIGAKTVVGRTPDVTGTLEIEGTTITTTDILVDMTTLTTDSGNRDAALRSQAIETNEFPEASFSLTTPIELASLPAEGEAVEVIATGDLTVHGVTQSVDIPLTAEVTNGVVVVVGELGPFKLADFDIDKPTAAVVLSVEDEATMELQLFFSQ